LAPRTKHQLLEWFALGVPAYRQRFRRLASPGATQRFNRLARTAMAWREELREPFTGLVEVDESMFGGVRRGGKRGWGAPGKVIVFGILKRNGLVRAAPMAAHGAREVERLIDRHTRAGALYYTDEWQAYATLPLRGDHVVVSKQRGGRPLGQDHINGIEGFWSYAKHWLYMYRGVPRKLFHLYLGEVCYRFNHRHEDLQPLIYRDMRAITMAELPL
jgi:transposase